MIFEFGRSQNQYFDGKLISVVQDTSSIKFNIWTQNISFVLGDGVHYHYAQLLHLRMQIWVIIISARFSATVNICKPKFLQNEFGLQTQQYKYIDIRVYTYNMLKWWVDFH